MKKNKKPLSSSSSSSRTGSSCSWGTWTGEAGCVPAPVPDLTVRLRDIPLTKVAVTKSTRLNIRYMPARHLQLARKSLFRSALHMHATVLTPHFFKCQKFINKCLPNNNYNNNNNHSEYDRCSGLSNVASLHSKFGNSH